MILRRHTPNSTDPLPRPSLLSGGGRVKRKLVGIGIDVVSRDKIKRLLDNHLADSINRLLTFAEKKICESSSDPVLCFSRLFAAKEAYFKAFNSCGMGEEGFRGIEVRIDQERGFQAISPIFDPNHQCEVEGEFFETPEGIGAKALLWRVCGEEG